MSEIRSRRPRLSRDGWLGLILAFPVILIMGGLVILPLISTFLDSFYRIDPMKQGTPFVGLTNYTNLFSNRTVLTAWGTTSAYVVLAVLIETIGGLMAALLLNRITRGRRWLLAAVVLPWCLPPVVNAVIWMWIYNPSYGLLNGALKSVGLIHENQVWFNNRATALFLISLVHAWRMMPLTAIILLAALQSSPAELYEASKLDGATAWQRLRSITLPLIAPGLAIALSQSTVFAINLFDEAWILNGTSTDTRSIMIQTYITAFQNLKLSAGMALSILAMVATLAVPAYTVMIPLYRMMISAGLIDTYTCVTLIYVSAFLPLALWLMRSVYQAMPLSLEEAAWLDGASKLYTLIRIVLPLAGPGIVACAILTFLSAWGQFMVPLVFSPTLATKPLTVLIPEFVTRNFVDYGLMNAAGMVAIVPPAILVLFLNRFLVQGLMAGASK